MPKKQPTASKKARALQRTTGGKHTALLAAQVCGQSLDPFGVYPDSCARAPHPDSEPHSDDRDFDVAAWKEQAAAEQAAAQASWDALTDEERAEATRQQFEDDYDDGRTASDDWEDARSWKWED
ncbi:hypothetical protein ACH4GZ_38905 [Streptomyces hygroscopicus]|uniref:hypothetical protein n=1 Tax=Streptomyces hygroscopicus TaxID=1912 RepID=UPI0037AC8376